MLAEVQELAKVFGLTPRPIDDGICFFGCFRYRAMYYAEDPNKLRNYLATDSRAFFVYPRGAHIDLPYEMARRGRTLRQLVPEGSDVPDALVLDVLAPRRRGGLLGRHAAGGGLNLRMFTWTLMMLVWYARLRSGVERRLCRPPMKWIFAFFNSSSVPRHIRVTGVSERTLKRDLAELLDPHPGSPAELLSAEFVYLWSQCDNPRFVMRESDIRLRTVVTKMLKLFPTDRHDPDLPEIGGKRPFQPL